MNRNQHSIRNAVFSALLLFVLAACAPPLSSGAYIDRPDIQVDKTAARIGEPVEITLTGGFVAAEKYYLETFTAYKVSLGACFLYTSDMGTEGGLCLGGEQPLPNGLSIVSSTTPIKDFGDIIVKRGEQREIKYTFAFTSNQPGTVDVVPVYQFGYEPNTDLAIETGPENTIRITFE